ncbi:uracil-DNA glycosylase family protein [Spongiivirga citrea]|uniref:Uracil-DNA glycosylase family protein n=1 Tax=Spongiivirga citrea TaxID=1481457 RepID=A0A6M0CU41_9FLAO|nr:uracil-DNA glycosylase family protein [Spongiivirga citrea]NER17290.1 uracil-DNA glycosylase family protein [Spongiivirga citrea]
MDLLSNEISSCDLCKAHLPLEPRPIFSISPKSKIVIIAQAPGKMAHDNHIAWKDPSGKRLRNWLGVTEDEFYNTENFAIIPMGFCFPGKAKTGDLPPRKECAPKWHPQILKQFENVKLTLLIGSYSTSYYLPNEKNNLTEKVKDYHKYLPNHWILPHPSPVNRFWRAKNPWFELEVIPKLQKRVQEIIKQQIHE